MLVSLDNVGVWNLRVENLDRWYLGQETYMKIINPEENGETELSAPSNVLYCGALSSMAKYISLEPYFTDSSLNLSLSQINESCFCCFHLQNIEEK